MAREQVVEGVLVLDVGLPSIRSEHVAALDAGLGGGRVGGDLGDGQPAVGAGRDVDAEEAGPRRGRGRPALAGGGGGDGLLDGAVVGQVGVGGGQRRRRTEGRE